MGLFSFTKKKPVLNTEEKNTWPTTIAQYQGLDKELEKLKKTYEQQLQALEAQAEQLLKPETIALIPERAQDISEQHAKRIYEEAQKLQGQEHFTKIFCLQEDIEQALDHIAGFKQRTNKNFSALKEYLGEQLRQVRQTSQELEDLLIKKAETIEQAGFDDLLRLKNVIKAQQDNQTKKDKYEKTINKYLTQKRHVEEKEQKHHARIQEQKNLLRDEKALDALKEVKALEEENAAIAQKYSRLVFDTKHYILKNLLTINDSLQQLFETIQKDPLYALNKHQETLQTEFKQLSQTLAQLEEEDTKDVTTRLEQASKQVNIDLQTTQENTPRLHKLKKVIMHDIAAINIYEQEQFLLKAQEEKAKIQEKIDVLAETLDELSIDALISEEEHLLAKLELTTNNKGDK